VITRRWANHWIDLAAPCSTAPAASSAICPPRWGPKPGGSRPVTDQPSPCQGAPNRHRRLTYPEAPPMPNLDPLNVNERLYRQVAKLLDQLEQGEHVTLRERFQALMAIARLQYVFVNLRKEEAGNEPAAGSSVRKYATAFGKANDPRRGKKTARGTAQPA